MSLKSKNLPKISSQIQFERVLLLYTRIFNFLGETCVHSATVPPPKSALTERLFSVLPSFISLSAAILLTVTNICMGIQVMDKYVESTNAIYFIYFGCVILTKFIAMSQIKSLSRILPKLFIKFRELQRFELKCKVNPSNIEWNFLSDVAMIFGFWIPQLTVTLLVKDRDESSIENYIDYVDMVALFMNRITICHVIFYVVLFNNFVDSYTEKVRLQARNRFNTISYLRTELVLLRAIHLKIYKIAKLVNDGFGWILLSIFMMELVDIIYEIYIILLFPGCAAITTTLRNLMPNLIWFDLISFRTRKQPINNIHIKNRNNYCLFSPSFEWGPSKQLLNLLILRG